MGMRESRLDTIAAGLAAGASVALFWAVCLAVGIRQLFARPRWYGLVTIAIGALQFLAVPLAMWLVMRARGIEWGVLSARTPPQKLLLDLSCGRLTRPGRVNCFVPPGALPPPTDVAVGEAELFSVPWYGK